LEWERAKNYILIAFVLLNLGLAALLFLEDRRYTLTPERIRTMHEVLSGNNINLYTAPMRRFAPMRHLEISGFYYDIDMLLGIFFPENEFTQEETSDDEHYIFFSENGNLEIFNGFITFTNENLENRAITHRDAIEISDAFINENFPDFVREVVFDEYGGGGVQIIYRQKYQGQLIFSNQIEFLITSGGIAWVEMQFGRVIGHSADTRRIFALDEVMLTFMQRMRHSAMENPIFINNIDIVYLKEYASNQEGSVYPAVPFYRIKIDDNDLEFLINAYTNESSNF